MSAKGRSEPVVYFRQQAEVGQVRSFPTNEALSGWLGGWVKAFCYG